MGSFGGRREARRERWTVRGGVHFSVTPFCTCAQQFAVKKREQRSGKGRVSCLVIRTHFASPRGEKSRLIKVQSRHVCDPIRQVWVAAHLRMEPRIGGDDRILLLNRKRKIEAVVDRMVEINRQPGGRRGELTHGEGTTTGAALSTPTASARSSPPMSPRRCMAHSALQTSAKRSSGAMSAASTFSRPRCPVGPFLLHEPFHNDATSIDYLARHAALSRSRSARMISLLSMEDRRRCRSALAREAKSCSPSRSALRRISLCSASADRPWAAALRFSERTTCGETFRTVSCAMSFACNEAYSLLSCIDPATPVRPVFHHSENQSVRQSRACGPYIEQQRTEMPCFVFRVS